ncbi:MAG: hypothetical protein ACU0B1_05105 [Thermohalobaculum sp.]
MRTTRLRALRHRRQQMEGMMFDTSQIVTLFTEDDRLPNPDTLKQYCLDPAALWVLKRRANLPYLPPRRLPAVARSA